MFSKACEYAIKAMLYIASQKEGHKVGVKDVAEAIDSPEAFTGKILQQLAKAKLLHSVKGPGGGFTLPTQPQHIKLADVVKAIDGEGIFKNCALGFKQCSSENPCPIHGQFKPIRESITHMLHHNTLQEIAADVIAGSKLLKI